MPRVLTQSGFLRGILVVAILAPSVAWCALAIYYGSQASEALRTAVSASLIFLTAAAIIWLRFRLAVATVAVPIVVVVIWWINIAPSNNRNWEPEVAVPATVITHGNIVTINNIRDFTYRTPTDFMPHYYNATFDIDDLAEVDLVVSHWSSDLIAHIFLTFGFKDGRNIAISVEVRRRRGETYSTLAGFFKHDELFYVVADERDLIGQRVFARAEAVYLYRLRLSPEEGRRLLLAYFRRVQSLAERPEFYNTLTTNCATGILGAANANRRVIAYNWRILLSGYADRYAYDLGFLATELPFPELKRRSRLASLESTDDSETFSERIRKTTP